MSDTILIIEDNPEVLENITEVLKLSGYAVLTALNGKEGLDAAKKNHPDLILCDIMMPELDGYGTLRLLSDQPDVAGIPFVFLTAKAENSDQRKGMGLGADDYLTKPFEGEELLRVVEARLKKKRIQKKAFLNSLDGLKEFISEAGKVIGADFMSEHHMVKKARKKDVIYFEGDSSVYMYMVASGKVKTYRTNEDGKEYITGIYKEGDFFGYSSMFDDFSRNESAIAIEDAELALVSRQDFQKALYSDKEVSLRFVRLISNNLNEAEQRLLKLAYDSARKRVAEALLFIFKKYDVPGDKFLALTRENISTVAGIAPESVSRNLSDFKEEGLIEAQEGHIRIIDFAKLQKLKG